MRNGSPGSRFLPILALAALIASSAVAALSAPVQDVPPELLRRAAAESGLSQQELLKKLRTAQAPTDTAAEPGRTELPPTQVVVLPFDLVQHADSSAATPEAIAAADTSSLFGADFFRLEPGMFAPPAFGPVPPDYLIGPGDQVFVDVFGEVEFRIERVVDRDGSLILPKGGKIACAGRTLEQVTRAVREKLAGSYSGIDPSGEGGTTFVDVNLGKLRAIRVFVVGEARQPGAYELTSLATAFTALYAAGGPNPQGSLRRIQVVRGNTTLATIDLYDYLLEGKRGDDPVLRDGDTVLIPERGPTVSIAGEVRRPLTYELRDGEGVRDLIRYAGGFTATAVTDMVHVTRIVPPAERRPEEPDRTQADLDLRLKMIHLMRDGDRVTVGRIPDRLENWVEVQGNVKRPGRYQYAEGMSVADLVNKAGGLWADTMGERALIERLDPDRTRRAVEVSLDAEMSGAAKATALHPQDRLRVYSKWDLQDRYQVAISGEVRQGGTFDWREGLTLRDLVLQAGGLRESADLLHAEVSRLRRDAIESRDVEMPPDSTVDNIEVELGADWLSRSGDFALQPHDRVAVRRLPWWELPRTVVLQGEVVYPGTYALEKPDERLSSVIMRAGGLKPTAYAPGARIVRNQDRIGNMALDLGKALERPGSEQDVILRGRRRHPHPAGPLHGEGDRRGGLPHEHRLRAGQEPGRVRGARRRLRAAGRQVEDPRRLPQRHVEADQEDLGRPRRDAGLDDRRAGQGARQRARETGDTEGDRRHPGQRGDDLPGDRQDHELTPFA